MSMFKDAQSKFVTGKVHGNQRIVGLRYMKVTLVDELKRLIKL